MRRYSSLKAWMRATHTTQAQLATDLKISKAYASMLARGERQPSLDVAFRIARRTSGAVPLEALLKEPLPDEVAS